MKSDLGNVTTKLNEFEGNLRGVPSVSGRGSICLKTLLPKQARMDKVLRDIIDQSVSSFHGLVSCLGGELFTLFRTSMEKAYSGKSVEYPVSPTHLSGIGTTSVSWCSDRDYEAESGPSGSKARTGAKLPIVEMVEKLGVVASLAIQ